MKKLFFVTSFILFCISLGAQQIFYYHYQDEKIFQQQRTDKIFLKIVPDTSKEQILTLINSDDPVQLTSNVNDNFIDI